MPNLFEAVINTFRTLIDNEPKAPLHTGEVTSCWFYYTALKEAIRFEEAGLNMTTDNEVVEMLKDAIKLCESQAKRIERFMVSEGIPLPETSAPKPKSNPNEVPLGVKLTDDEIANGVSIKMAAANLECGMGQSQSIRNDVGFMWLEFQVEILTFGATLKTLMRKRGWIKVPPYYYPPGKPIE